MPCVNRDPLEAYTSEGLIKIENPGDPPGPPGTGAGEAPWISSLLPSEDQSGDDRRQDDRCDCPHDSVSG